MKHYIVYALLLSFLHKTNTAINTKDEKIIICGVGKNIAHSLPNMRKKIESLSKHFKDYTVIIYENNSTDNTQKLLKQWAQENTKIHVIIRNHSSKTLYHRTRLHALKDKKTPCRMELIAYARNRVLQKALKPEFDDFNFLIMTDLDFNQGWEVDGVLSCFAYDDWDCMAANSIMGNAIYYDRYAYRDENFPLGPELLGEEFWNNLHRTSFTIPANSTLRKVYSAFGGIAVYKKSALKNCRYSGVVTQDLDTLLKSIVNADTSKTNIHYVLYKKSLKTDETVLPIKFQPNSGYDGPTVCEHSTLHATMICNGYDKIYVNPAMICRY